MIFLAGQVLTRPGTRRGGFDGLDQARRGKLIVPGVAGRRRRVVAVDPSANFSRRRFLAASRERTRSVDVLHRVGGAKLLLPGEFARKFITGCVVNREFHGHAFFIRRNRSGAGWQNIAAVRTRDFFREIRSSPNCQN